VEEWEAELVVVGLPLSLSGADGPAARAAREEAAELGACSAIADRSSMTSVSPQ
jgi:RNase H-fold protein (predicted Holliday junction resolvase)